MRSIVIIYHGDCPDGFGGAWAAWKKFDNQATYIAAKHHEPPLSELKNKEIYFIDFIYPQEIVRKLIKNNKKVVAVDHHITAKKVVELTEDYLYAIKHSGSVLAWRYFHSNKPVPRLLRHIEDIDLWKFNLPHTREIISFINLFKYDFAIWNKIAIDLEKLQARKKIIAQGAIVLKYEEHLVEKLIANAEPVEFAGYKTLAVNSPVLESEIGAALVKRMPPIGIVWRQKGGKKVFCLRSDGTADVAKIAQRFGGGGHKRASGFSLPAAAKLPWQVVKK